MLGKVKDLFFNEVDSKVYFKFENIDIVTLGNYSFVYYSAANEKNDMDQEKYEKVYSLNLSNKIGFGSDYFLYTLVAEDLTDSWFRLSNLDLK